MKRSKALFLLVGPKIVEETAKNHPGWKFTQNWIAYEVGLACALGIDVWVVCDGVKINFPVPYLNNYTAGIIRTTVDSWHRKKLQQYVEGKSFSFKSDSKFAVSCPYDNCGAKFNFYTVRNKNETATCPTCLREIDFPEGWLPKPQNL